MSRRTGSLEEELARFEARSTRTEIGCLIGPHKGYGEFKYDGGLRISAHRASYLIHNGAIPDGHLIRHTCDNPPCIEPSHLLTGTVADNSADMAERRRGLIGLRHHFASVAPDVIEEAVAQYLRGGFSQAEMARRLGVSQTAFGSWVRGKMRRDAELTGVEVGKGYKRLAWSLKPCGTKAAYERHHYEGTPVCDACREAHRTYMREYKARRRWVGVA